MAKAVGQGGAMTLEAGAAPATSVGSTHLPLRHAVLEEIRRRIIAGAYCPGERIFEDQLAADLDVSRNPVREALQALAGEGFIELEPRRGARIAIVSQTRAGELFEVREVLEGLVASLAARRRTDAEVAAMRAVVEEGRDTAARGNLTALPELNTRFHSLLANTARNAMLADTIEHLRHLIEWIYSQRIAQRAPRSWEEHSQIVDAIASEDAAAAERVARAHIANARAAYVDLRDRT